MLLYDYQYDVAALLAAGLLLLSYFLRRGYRTYTSTIFITALICDVITAIFDIASIITISNPQDYPVWFNYITSLGYLFFFNCISVVFLVYIYSKTRAYKARKLVRAVNSTCTAFFSVSILSSPWTHWIAYFDENGVYQHGPLMNVLFVIPFLIFVLEIYLFYQAKERMNWYQILASSSFIITMAGCLIVQILLPRVLICALGCAIIMFFIYLAFENPAYYTYRDSRCPNRTAFNDRLNVLKKKKQNMQIIAFILEDYDYLMESYGQNIIDTLNSRLADSLYSNFGSRAFHLSGELNIIMLKEGEDSQPYLDKLNRLFSTPFRLENDDIPVDINVRTFPSIDCDVSSTDLEILLSQSLKNSDFNLNIDQAILEIREKRARRSNLLHAIQKAIAGNEFQVYYQPIRHTFSQTFSSAEALIRLITPELGFVNPEEMIVLAEENGYIDKIGEIVFRKVCRFIHENGLQKLGVKYIEINLSPMQCMQDDLVERFYSIMKEYEIKPEWINLEVTETAQMAGQEKILDCVKRFANIGVSLSIDDYGSGFASADYLIKLPVSIVKIDKMILWNAMKNANAMIVLTNTIRMIKDLGKHIVVEGVEDDIMVEVLTATGCDYMQGYFYSKPLPEADYLEFLKKNQPST